MHICAHAFCHCMGAIWWGQLPFQATELVNKHLGWFHEGQEELREAEPQKDSSFWSPLTSSLLYTYERRAWQAGAGETEDFVCFCSFPPQVAAWINEKNSIAQDDSWKDPSNLQTKLQRHQTFQAEIMANRNHLDSIKSVRELGFWARVGNWHERLQTVWVTVISKKGGGGTVISLVLSMLSLSALRSLFF